MLSFLSGNDDDTIAGAHTVKGRCSLSLKDVYALNVIGIYVKCTAWVVWTGNGFIGINIGGRCDRHTVNHIERSVVAVKWTGTADNYLWRSTGHTRWRGNVNTWHLTLKGGTQRGVGRIDKFFTLDILDRITQSLLFTADTHSSNNNVLNHYFSWLKFYVDYLPSVYRNNGIIITHEREYQCAIWRHRNGVRSVQVSSSTPTGTLNRHSHSRHGFSVFGRSGNTCNLHILSKGQSRTQNSSQQ